MKFLLVFDFDHTIVDDNSDTWIVNCAPGRKLPDVLRSSYERGKWTEYMGRVFHYLGDQGVRANEMKKMMTAIPFTAGIHELLDFIAHRKHMFDCIIISDSNAVFIDWILKSAGLLGVFDAIFTNPATFDDFGYLVVQNFHAHLCSECPSNLCKRKMLEEFVDVQLQHGVQYTKIVYIGDGGNDLCPIKFLKKNDVAMPREGYELHRRIIQMSPEFASVRSYIIVWSTGFEILSYLKLLLED
ncbi:pyridoxal phosphate phosphatase PHOSPHO2 [Microcaecilia unicolor]|uniref:Pyridoxal phosphate phosphatase PHOSPHO2 n=1 Tax=Microcaecilia unicolor TaxID=1415580 RepID=A0A6P7YQP4_9AMPH|nr:pyridoxal phosphate phosphatase PHOSPHO2 [Microcaecilia unicolor]XP_030065565.1 pyridoxal phosphate phosphatase PHOSPHO2 [Microcaecilia unicolor]XP_030065566.1 pyridoxal phosphate phosphatase PHOSPHO2 [Microcaecilia unicolor]